MRRWRCLACALDLAGTGDDKLHKREPRDCSTILLERMNDHRANNLAENAQPKRGLILRLLYRVYTNYLGVTPPKPSQERMTAGVLIGGVVAGFIAIIALVFFLWDAMTKMGGR
jgi:hypothetical protein